jgi:hypothetical protein
VKEMKDDFVEKHNKEIDELKELLNFSSVGR